MNDTITEIQIKDCTLYHADCINLFDEIGKVDIVITDPPYGIGESNKKNASRGHFCKATNFGHYNWDKNKIELSYFEKIFSCSTNQIIFGGNYYANWFPPSSCWIVWDKNNGKTDFADCELAYTSFSTAVRKIKYKWQGMLQEDMKNKEKRYHPTQKPVYVMRWIIDDYTKQTDTILDPFMGSGPTGVAAVIGGREFIGIEKEKQYFDIACKRIRWASKQQALFGVS